MFKANAGPKQEEIRGACVLFADAHVLSPDLHEKIHALLEVQSIRSLETFQSSMRTMYRSRTESNMFFWLENMETITSGENNPKQRHSQGAQRKASK